MSDQKIGITTPEASSPLHLWWATTDKRGYFKHRTPPGKRMVYLGGPVPDGYTKETSNPRSPIMQVEFDVVDGESYSADFAIPREKRSSGEVEHASGEPAPEANLSLTGRDVSDDSDVLSYDLTAKFRGMSGSKDASVHPDTDEELELLKNAYSSAMGRVIDQDGKPIKGAVVRWSSVEMGQVSEKTMTDEEGRFEAKKLWPCEQIVFYGSKAGYGQNLSFAAFKEGKVVELDSIVLHIADQTISGKVVDSTGVPVKAATVELGGQLQPQGVEVSTDAEGKFIISGVVAGWLDLDVRKQKFHKRVRVKTGWSDMTIKLPNQPLTERQGDFINHIGKPAPPLKAETWFHSSPLPEHQPGRVRLIEFVGMDRPLIYFSNTLPLLEKLRKELPGPELEIILVHGPWPKEEVTEILARDYPDFKIPVAIEPEQGGMSAAFGVRSWLTVVIDQGGNVVFQNTGKWGEARKKIRELLGKE